MSEDGAVSARMFGTAWMPDNGIVSARKYGTALRAKKSRFTLRVTNSCDPHGVTTHVSLRPDILAVGGLTVKSPQGDALPKALRVAFI